MRDSVSLRIRRLPGRNSQGHCHSRLRGKWIRALSPTEWRFDKACPRYGSDALRAPASAKQPTAAHTAPTVATALASALSTTFSRSRLAATTIATTIASALSPLSASGPAAEPESEPQPEPVSQPNQPSSEPALATFDPTADAAALSRSHLAAAGIAP